LNSPCAPSGTHKLTGEDHSRSFSHSDSSDIDAELDGLVCLEDNLVDNDGQSLAVESLGSFLSQNEQLLLEELDTEDSSECADSSSMMQIDCSEIGSAVIHQGGDTDDSGRKVPSIEDFCSKDTKTLNTNVLMAEATEELATDSEKFHKAENVAETSGTETIDDEVTSSDQLQELLLAACDGSVNKPVKETNLLANCREKFADTMKTTHSVAAYALNSAADVDCFISSMKQFCGKPAGTTQLTVEPESDRNYDNINNIKRIKIDDQAEKNLRMQTKLKVNTEQNQTRSSSPPVADCTATNNAIPSDQLIVNSSSPVAISAAGSQTLQSLAVSCSVDVITARHIQRAESAWRAYTSRNRSVIVDTFQGQFKSTVCYSALLLIIIYLPLKIAQLSVPEICD